MITQNLSYAARGTKMEVYSDISLPQKTRKTHINSLTFHLKSSYEQNPQSQYEESHHKYQKINKRERNEGNNSKDQ